MMNGVFEGTIAVAVPRGLGVKVGVVGTALSGAADGVAVSADAWVAIVAGVSIVAGNNVDDCNAALAEVEPQAAVRHIKMQ